MKKFLFLITALILGGLSVNATTTTKENHENHSTTLRGYGNSFIFVENGIEFSVFPDGQFDFYMPSYGPNVNVSAPRISISFNSGYDYNPFLQYDEFGAIIQVEHVPVYYDYYGRVSQIGNIFINYNGRGYVTQVGGLFIHYNRYQTYSHCTGFINLYNRHYVYRPWHNYYRIPAFNHCVIYNRPYRQHYKPIRYSYSQPYYNNYRRTTAVASRRGNTVYRSDKLATRPSRANSTPRRDVRGENPRSNQLASNTVRPRKSSEMNSPRSNGSVSTKPRSSSNTVRPRKGSEMNSPRSNNHVSSKPRTTANSVKPRKSSQMNSPRTQTRGNTIKKNGAVGKPKSSNNRTYNSKSNKNRQIASNTRSKR